MEGLCWMNEAAQYRRRCVYLNPLRVIEDQEVRYQY